MGGGNGATKTTWKVKCSLYGGNSWQGTRFALRLINVDFFFSVCFLLDLCVCVRLSGKVFTHLQELRFIGITIGFPDALTGSSFEIYHVVPVVSMLNETQETRGFIAWREQRKRLRNDGKHVKQRPHVHLQSNQTDTIHVGGLCLSLVYSLS